MLPVKSNRAPADKIPVIQIMGINPVCHPIRQCGIRSGTNANPLCIQFQSGIILSWVDDDNRNSLFFGLFEPEHLPVKYRFCRVMSPEDNQSGIQKGIITGTGHIGTVHIRCHIRNTGGRIGIIVIQKSTVQC